MMLRVEELQEIQEREETRGRKRRGMPLCIKSVFLPYEVLFNKKLPRRTSKEWPVQGNSSPLFLYSRNLLPNVLYFFP